MLANWLAHWPDTAIPSDTRERLLAQTRPVNVTIKNMSVLLNTLQIVSTFGELTQWEGDAGQQAVSEFANRRHARM